MTEKEALKKLKTIEKDNDFDSEATHYEADKILCEVLKSLGHKKLVKKFEGIEKWYS